LENLKIEFVSETTARKQPPVRPDLRGVVDLGKVRASKQQDKRNEPPFYINGNITGFGIRYAIRKTFTFPIF
jgi:hypothetical protein